jgi:hypothetical protein
LFVATFIRGFCFGVAVFDLASFRIGLFMT